MGNASHHRLTGEARRAADLDQLCLDAGARARLEHRVLLFEQDAETAEILLRRSIGAARHLIFRQCDGWDHALRIDRRQNFAEHEMDAAGVDVVCLQLFPSGGVEIAAVAAHGRAVLDQRDARVRIAQGHVVGREGRRPAAAIAASHGERGQRASAH